MLKINHCIVGGPYGRNPKKVTQFSQPVAPSYFQPTAPNVFLPMALLDRLLAIASASVAAETRAQELQQQHTFRVEAMPLTNKTTLRLDPTAPEFITPPPSATSSPLRATAKPFISTRATFNAKSEVEIEKSQNESEYKNLAELVVASPPNSLVKGVKSTLRALDTFDDDKISILCLDSVISEDERSPLETSSPNSGIGVDSDFSDSKWITRNGRSYSFDNSDEYLSPAFFSKVNTPCSASPISDQVQPVHPRGVEYLLSLVDWVPGAKDQLRQRWALIEQTAKVGIKVCLGSSDDTIRLLSLLKWKTDSDTLMTEYRNQEDS